MARKPRIEYPGAFYHVLSRGNRTLPIFKDDEDRLRFLLKLEQYRERYCFIPYAYTLMENHFHLLIETQEVPLSRIMQGLLQSSTQWHNKKYKAVGHLFQGRYKAILCDRRMYLLGLVRYLHLNCVRAGLVRDPSEYRWSSHRAYLGLEKSSIVETDFVLSQFAKSRKKAVRLFNEFVMEWIDIGRTDKFYQVVDQRILGDNDFTVKVKRKAGEEIRKEETIFKNRTLEEIAEAVEETTSVSVSELRSRKRAKHIVDARSLFVHLSIIYSPYKRKEIAEFLGRVPRNIPYLERRIDNQKLRDVLKKIQW
jgi:REP element-mobilizing transposase RayT